METLLGPDEEFFKLNSYAPLLRKLRKSMIEYKEFEQNGNTLKAVHGYLRVEKELFKALNDHKKRFDVTILDPIFADVQKIIKDADPDGLLQIEIDKKHKKKLKTKIFGNNSTPSSPRVIFLNDQEVDIIEQSKNPNSKNSTPLPVKNIKKMMGVSLADPRIAKSLTKVTQNPIFKIANESFMAASPKPDPHRDSGLTFSPPRSSRLFDKPIRTMSQDSPTLQKRALKHAHHMMAKEDRRKSIFEEINLDVPTRSTLSTKPISNIRRTESVLDTTGYKNREVEETYETCLQCIFFPSKHLMSTRSMLNVVQTSFHYTKERHMELEERALNDVNYQTFIALLNAQLENLQQHSFYDKDKFKNEEEYEKFLDLETKRIEGVIRSLEDHISNQRNKTLPEVTLKPFNYHRLYSLLLRLLIRHTLDKKNQRGTASQADLKAYFKQCEEGYEDITLLSPFSIWLLEEFGDRTGIRKLFRNISLFEIATDLYEVTEEYLHLLITLLKKILGRLSGGEPFTFEEKKMWEHSADKLRCSIRLQLEDYSNIPKTADSQHLLKHIIELLDLLSSFDQYSDFKPHNTKDILLECVKSSVDRRFGLMMEGGVSQKGEKTQGIELMNNICDEITLEIGATYMHEQPFKKFFDVSKVVVDGLFDRLEPEVRHFFQNITSNVKEVSAREVVALSLKLIQLNKRFSKNIEVEGVLASFLKNWVSSLSLQYTEWVKTAVSTDNWETMDDEELQISHSVLDLFCMFSEPIAFLQEISPIIPTSSSDLLSSYNHVMCQAINLYAKKLGEVCSSSFPEENKNVLMRQAKRNGVGMSIFITEDSLKFPAEWSQEEDKFDMKKQMSFGYMLGSRLRKWSSKFKKAGAKRQPNSPNVLKIEAAAPGSTTAQPAASDDSNSVSPKSCVQMNNLEFARTKLDELMQECKFSEEEDCFVNTLTYIKKKLDHIIQLNVYWMNLYIQKEIQLYLKDRKSCNSEKMISFLDRQLEVMYDNLMSPLFRRSFARLWEVIIQDIQTALVGERNPTTDTKIKLSNKNREHANVLLNEMKEFFHAGGKGLSDGQMEAPMKALGLDRLLKVTLEIDKRPTSKKESKPNRPTVVKQN